MNYKEIIEKRRSIRSFKTIKIENEIIQKLTDSLQKAPSSRSLFPCEFIVVNDEDKLLKLSGSKDHGSTFLANAPLAIVVIANPEISDVWIEDASIASTIIMLTAVDLGLASCWVQTRKRMTGKSSSEDYVKEILKIPSNYRVAHILALGYPDDKPAPEKKKKFDSSKIFFNSYDKIK